MISVNALNCHIMPKLFSGLFLFFLLARSSVAVDLNPADQRCVDNQGHLIDSGDRFIPSRNRPCTECLCARGNAVLCGIAICVGQVNCSQSRWNSTLCCKPECINQKRQLLSDLRSSNYNPTAADRPAQGTPRDLQRSNNGGLPPGSGYFDTGAVFGMDDAAGYVPSNYDVFNMEHEGAGPGSSTTGNGTSTGVSRAQSLPSPYYPILIGLISCAPVALCIICINALRKYFHTRNHHSHRGLFPPSRRRHHHRHAPPTSPAGELPPPAYMDPPPAYKDLDAGKFKAMEELPRYEDVVLQQDERLPSAPTPIFATTSSAQFQGPERVTFVNPAFSHTENETLSSTSETLPTTATLPVDSGSRKEVDAPMVKEADAERTLVRGTSSEPSSRMPSFHIRRPTSVRGIDNPAHEP